MSSLSRIFTTLPTLFYTHRLRWLCTRAPQNGVPPPKGRAPNTHKEMLFKAGSRHEFRSVDVRYIEEHGLGFPEPLYMMSILENYGRALLASKISRTQNQWEYPEALQLKVPIVL